MAGKPRVFVTRILPEAGLQLLRDGCDAEVWPEPLPPPANVLRAKVAVAAGLVSLLTDRIDSALLEQAPHLKVVSNFAVGFNNIDVAACTARGIAVGNTPDVLTNATADMAFCLLIAAARRVVEAHRYTLSGRWQTWEPLGHLGQELTGRTLGVVGLGRIGVALAQRCRGGWGMNILYNDLHPNPAAERALGARRVDLDDLLRESDFISLHANLTENTRGMIGVAQLRKMKRSAVLVNTARGPLIDQPALVVALREGTIFAAGLDVTDPEPPRPDDPLLQLPNAIVAPHIASATVTARNQMAELCARNLLAGLAGQPLPGWVNPEMARK
jgi:glyoxylate reductase